MAMADHASRPILLRILQFLLVRLLVLGAIVFFTMTTNNGFMGTFKSTPALSTAVTIGMILCTSMGVILLRIAIRRGLMLPPPWKRQG